MKVTRHQIDTVQAKDCHDPADYVTVHKDYLAMLTLAARLPAKVVAHLPIPDSEREA